MLDYLIVGSAVQVRFPDVKAAQFEIAAVAGIESDLVSLPELAQRPGFVVIVLELVFVLESVHFVVAVLVLGSAMRPAGTNNTLIASLVLVSEIGLAAFELGQLEPALAGFVVPEKQAIGLVLESGFVFVKVCECNC